MAGSGWQRKFEDPIPLPGGRKLVTLRGAADYITNLPKKESDLPEWQTAIAVLMLMSQGGPTMMARIGVMKALNRHVVREPTAGFSICVTADHPVVLPYSQRHTRSAWKLEHNFLYDWRHSY